MYSQKPRAEGRGQCSGQCRSKPRIEKHLVVVGEFHEIFREFSSTTAKNMHPHVLGFLSVGTEVTETPLRADTAAATFAICNCGSHRGRRKSLTILEKSQNNAALRFKAPWKIASDCDFEAKIGSDCDCAILALRTRDPRCTDRTSAFPLERRSSCTS